MFGLSAELILLPLLRLTLILSLYSLQQPERLRSNIFFLAQWIARDTLLTGSILKLIKVFYQI